MPLAIITFLDNEGRPSNELPGYGGGPVDPGYGRPSYGGRPDNTLPGGGHIATLPVFPFDPTRPSNELPEVPVIWPPRPGQRFVIKWLACTGLILVPDNSLPTGGEEAEPK